MIDRPGFKQLSSVPATREKGSLSLVNSEMERLRSERFCVKALQEWGLVLLCFSIVIIAPSGKANMIHGVVKRCCSLKCHIKKL
jgi:hypothetical protein